MFPANELIYAAEVDYRRQRAMEAVGPRRQRRRIRLSLFPKIQSVTHLSRDRSHWTRAA